MFELVNNVCCNVGLDSVDAVTHRRDRRSPMHHLSETEDVKQRNKDMHFYISDRLYINLL